MNNLKAFVVIATWSMAVLFGLYLIDAHLHYRDIGWAIVISIALLVTHMVNFTIYFKFTGNEPYRWFKQS